MEVTGNLEEGDSGRMVGRKKYKEGLLKGEEMKTKHYGRVPEDIMC